MTDPSAPTPPTLTFICRLVAVVGAAHDLGLGATGRRRFIPVTGGTLAGPCLNGRVLPGGGDWQTVREDGVVDLAARYILELTDGTLVEFENRGLRHGPNDRSARGADDAAASMGYFQTTARISTPPGPHEWLMRTIFIAGAERRDEAIHLDLFAVGLDA